MSSQRAISSSWQAAVMAATSRLSHGRRVNSPSLKGEEGGFTSNALPDGRDDLLREARKIGEELGAGSLQSLDSGFVEVLLPRPELGAARLQEIDIGRLDSRHLTRDEIAEVGVALPLDRSLRDSLHDRGRVRDPHLLGTRVAFRASDSPCVHQVNLERV